MCIFEMHAITSACTVYKANHQHWPMIHKIVLLLNKRRYSTFAVDWGFLQNSGITWQHTESKCCSLLPQSHEKRQHLPLSYNRSGFSFLKFKQMAQLTTWSWKRVVIPVTFCVVCSPLNFHLQYWLAYRVTTEHSCKTLRLWQV